MEGLVGRGGDGKTDRRRKGGREGGLKGNAVKERSRGGGGEGGW